MFTDVISLPTRFFLKKNAILRLRFQPVDLTSRDDIVRSSGTVSRMKSGKDGWKSAASPYGMIE